MNHKSVIIIAGGTIQHKFKKIKSNNSSPVLLPINSKVLGQYILEYHDTVREKSIYLAVDENMIPTIQNELYETLTKTNTRLIPIINSKNIIQSINQSIRHNSIKDDICINIVTTIPTKLLNIDELLIENHSRENKEWAGFIINGNQTSFVKRGENKVSQAFQGVFSCKKDIIQKAIEDIDSNDLIDLIEKMIENGWKPKFIESKWIDCGHEENYFQARKELINSRNFNQLKINGNTISKSSTNKEKIQAELYYYQNIPIEFKIFFPTIINNNTTNSNTSSYEMTYFNSPNLAELSLYWDIKAEGFLSIFQCISDFIIRSKHIKTKITEDEYLSFYINKTKNRLNEFSHFTSNNLIENDRLLIINGKECFSFEQLITKVESRLKKLYKETTFSFIHGDLCFNNIIVNTDDFSIKLIDPRGSFGSDKFSIYGDSMYDIAKLAHSSIYHYDYFIADLFHIEQSSDNTYKLTFNLRDNTHILFRLTDDIIHQSNYNQKDIKLIVGLLFLSMTPIHSDSPRRQLAMYLHGLQILNESINE